MDSTPAPSRAHTPHPGATTYQVGGGVGDAPAQRHPAHARRVEGLPSTSLERVIRYVAG